MANSPFIDLNDEIALRRFLSDLHGSVTSTQILLQQAGLSADSLKLLSSEEIKEKIRASVKEFDDSMWDTINEVTTNLKLLIPSDNDIVKTIDDELKVTSSNLTASVKNTALTAIAEDGTWATAQSVNEISSNLSTNYATASQIAGTYATKTAVGAIYEVSVEANGHVSGYRAVATGSTPSVFQIYAEQFAISSSSTEEGYSPFQVDTANHKINMTSNVAIDGDLLLSGTITASRIRVGHIGTALSTEISKEITDTGTYPNTPSSSTNIGSARYTNYADTEVKILVTILGRSGITGGDPTGGTAWYGLYEEGNILYNYGWTYATEDSHTLAGVATIPANSSKTFSMGAVKDGDTANNYTLVFSGKIVILGIAQGE